MFKSNSAMYLTSESLLDLVKCHQPDDEREGGVATQNADPQLRRPSMYRVIMMNDDFTPMEFVVEVLQRFFGKSSEQATQIMLTVHTKGSAVCAVYTRDVAETKAELVNQYARECQHPLLCEVAPADD